MSKVILTVGNIDTDTLPIQIDALNEVSKLILDGKIIEDDLSEDITYDNLLQGVRTANNILRAMTILIDMGLYIEKPTDRLSPIDTRKPYPK